MIRQVGKLFLASVVCGFTFVFAIGVILADDKKVPTIQEIMSKGHSGKKSLLNKIKEGAKAEKWDDIAEAGKTLKQFGEDLGKNKPERGSDDSWKKLSGLYQETTAEIAAGVEKKDAKATADALGKMSRSCKTCHDAHK